MTRDDDFEPKLGKIRSRGSKRGRKYLHRMLQATMLAGGRLRSGSSTRKAKFHGSQIGRGASIGRMLGSRDRYAAFRSRRVVVKSRIVKLAGNGIKGARAHLRYVQRDGVTRDGHPGELYGKKGCVYSAFEDEADGKAFIERGREDRHQFRFIVAPEDAAELSDMRSFTRYLMGRMEEDLGTRLDWVAIDHHNTGHPHTHILLRGVTEDGKILNIAGDYIAHGIRHRASELVTREIGPQTEIEVARKLTQEVDADRLTRLDRMLIAEQEERSVIDLRPGGSDSYTIRANRYLLIDRAKKLERLGLATEIEPGWWELSDKAARTLKELGVRGDIIKTIHRALQDHGLDGEHGPSQYVVHSKAITEPIVGRVLAKGLAGDGMDDRLYTVIDGVDGRTHYVETNDATKLEAVKCGHIAALDPILPKEEPRAADRNIQIMAAEDGIYRPSKHLEAIRETFLEHGKDPDAFVRFHVRRLEALRRAGHVERIDADHWRVPTDITERGIAYDMRNRGKDFTIRALSAFDLEAQIGSDGASWLDRELAARNPLPLRKMGFELEVDQALDGRAYRLVELGLATRDPQSGVITFARGFVHRLEQREVARVGRELAQKRGTSFIQASYGEYVSGTLTGSINLMSGRYGVLDNGFQFQLVPWQPVLEKRIGQEISGHVRDSGGIDWDLGRKRGLGIGM